MRGAAQARRGHGARGAAAALVAALVLGALTGGCKREGRHDAGPPAVPAAPDGATAGSAAAAPATPATGDDAGTAKSQVSAGVAAGGAFPSPAAWLATFPVPIGGYEPLPAVPDAGRIQGRVRLVGPARAHAAERAPDAGTACERESPGARLAVGEDGGVAHTLVWLSDIRRGRRLEPGTRVTVSRRGCAVEPRLQVAPLGGTVELLTEEPLLHNVHAYLGAATLFNVGLTAPGQRHFKPLRKAGLVELRNDAGPAWMLAYLLVAEHPYYAVTDGRGAFTLEGVPPGRYTLRTWHEGWRRLPADEAGEATYEAPHTSARPVEVSAGATLALDLPLGG